MMQLYSLRDKDEVELQPVLKDIRDVIQVAECHSSEDDDVFYVFLVWADFTDEWNVRALKANAEREGADFFILAPGIASWCEDVSK
jgi:hypothetical protein